LYDSVDEGPLKSNLKMSEVQNNVKVMIVADLRFPILFSWLKKSEPAKVKYWQLLMRSHLINCFEKRKMTAFPTQHSRK